MVTSQSLGVPRRRVDVALVADRTKAAPGAISYLLAWIDIMKVDIELSFLCLLHDLYHPANFKLSSKIHNSKS